MWLSFVSVFSPAEVASLAVMSQKGVWCTRPPKQKQPKVKSDFAEYMYVLEHLNVENARSCFKSEDMIASAASQICDMKSNLLYCTSSLSHATCNNNK